MWVCCSRRWLKKWKLCFLNVPNIVKLKEKERGRRPFWCLGQKRCHIFINQICVSLSCGLLLIQWNLEQRSLFHYPADCSLSGGIWTRSLCLIILMNYNYPIILWTFLYLVEFGPEICVLLFYGLFLIQWNLDQRSVFYSLMDCD